MLIDGTAISAQGDALLSRRSVPIFIPDSKIDASLLQEKRESLAKIHREIRSKPVQIIQCASRATLLQTSPELEPCTESRQELFGALCIRICFTDRVFQASSCCMSRWPFSQKSREND